MSFAKELDDVYKSAIKAAIENSDGKYHALRVDKEEYNDKIDDKIISEIRRSKFVVTDVTMQRPSVYFEAGYALGMNIPVIWACREDEINNNKLCFDSRQFKHISWKDEKDYYEKLLNRINATII